ncbi:Hpt domain-containing protein [Maridesulfovibrio ferrireducens]|uniref:Hpt domain-containing protein n=1 Tax=Maridesulfovibrio ferrireducens TaxID=246191 RepID=A0A1G9D3W7_9BACT|nr:Hpt domain-containing protein [Maridesulfovibrio ferrireducens]SDK58355.1 Hpt domain-containing protein [Maridesulfovibrio ferrireducens]
MNLAEYSDRFDIEAALARFSGDSELLSEAIAIYKEEAVKHLKAIGEALQVGDMEKVCILAHTLKGESGAVGAIAAQQRSSSLETAIKNIDKDRVNELYRKVSEEVSIALQVLPDVIE